MKYLKKFEINNYLITTNTDLRYAIILEYEGKKYVRYTLDGIGRQFIALEHITNISQVIKFLPKDVEEAIKNFDKEMHTLTDVKFKVMPIDELELLINTNKYNL